jgi:hypothetical protein
MDTHVPAAIDPDKLAGDTSTTGRWVREWLAAQAASVLILEARP